MSASFTGNSLYNSLMYPDDFLIEVANNQDFITGDKIKNLVEEFSDAKYYKIDFFYIFIIKLKYKLHKVS